MWLAPPGAQKVEDQAARGDEGVGQHPPVAPPPQRLGAHEGRGSIPARSDQPLEPGFELFGVHVVGVPAEGGGLERSVRRLARGLRLAEASQLPPPYVCDAGSLEAPSQGVLTELRMLARAGRGSNVDQPLESRVPE